MKLTIEQYAKQFKMSKEMISSKLRAKKLNYIIEESITYILVPKSNPQKEEDKKVLPKTIRTIAKPKTTVATVLALYKRENDYLKSKIQQLEEKVDCLIDDKEQMLRDERDKIEQIYSNKDEQLKNVLELINAKMIHEKNQQETIHEIEHNETPEIIELKYYLHTLDLRSSQRKTIKKRFNNVAKNDIRIIEQNGKLYLDFTKYDYSDLLAL